MAGIIKTRCGICGDTLIIEAPGRWPDFRVTTDDGRCLCEVCARRKAVEAALMIRETLQALDPFQKAAIRHYEEIALEEIYDL